MVQTITIKESILNKLILQKKEDESFNDLFERLLDNQVQGIETLTKLRAIRNLKGMLKRRSFLYLGKYLKRSMQIHLIIINTNALVEILDRQSKVSQQLVEKIQKSNDGFAIIVLTFMIVLHSFAKLQKTFLQYICYRYAISQKKMLKKRQSCNQIQKREGKL